MKRLEISLEDRLAYLGFFREALDLAIDSPFHYLLFVDSFPAVNGGDSFYAGHWNASAIGWVGASQPAATARVD